MFLYGMWKEMFVLYYLILKLLDTVPKNFLLFVLNYSWSSTCAVIYMLGDNTEIVYRKLECTFLCFV